MFHLKISGVLYLGFTNLGHRTIMLRQSKYSSFSELCPLAKKYIEVRGKDTKKFLQGLCTNDTNKLINTSCIAAAFLTSKGRIFADTFLMKLDSSDIDVQNVVIEVDESASAQLLSHLLTYKLRSQLTISARVDIQGYQEIFSDEDDTNQNIGIVKDNKGELLRVSDPRDCSLGTKVVKLVSSVSKEDDQLFPSAKLFNYLNGVADGSDLINRIPLECNMDLLNYISFTKGCYVGQELTARTKYKGLVRKRIVPFLTFPVSKIMEVGTAHTSCERKPGDFGFASLSTHSRMMLYQHLKGIPKNVDFISEDSVHQTAILREAVKRSVSEGPCKIFKSSDGRRATDLDAVGEIICMDDNGALGLAMIRLSETIIGEYSTEVGRLEVRLSHELLPSELNNSACSKDFGRSLEIHPFKPKWWPDLDPTTGKSLFNA